MMRMEQTMLDRDVVDEIDDDEYNCLTSAGKDWVDEVQLGRLHERIYRLLLIYCSIVNI